MKFVIGIILLCIGLLIVVKSEWMLNNFGHIGFFDQKLGTEGGSRLGYKLIGILFIFLGVLCVTGLIGGFMAWLTAPLTKHMITN